MILLLCYFSACQGGWFCVIELNRSIGRPAFHRGWRQTGRPREGRPHFKHSLLTYSKTLMAPKSGDPGCDHEGDFVHGQPPQHLSGSGSGKGGYTDRQGGPSVLGEIGEEGSSRLYTNSTRICSRIIRNFGTRHRSRLPSLCKYASGHLLYPFLANLYLGSG